MTFPSSLRRRWSRWAVAAVCIGLSGCAGQERTAKPGNEAAAPRAGGSRPGQYGDAMAGSDADRAEAAMWDNAAQSENRGPVAPANPRSGRRAADQPRVTRP